MKEKIEKLKKQGIIAEENIGIDQIINHITRANKDLDVSRANLEIDTEASYSYAYLAMLRAGRALMFSFGYRPIGTMQHKTIVLFSESVLGEEFSVLVFKFDKMRKTRNRFTYDEPGILVSRKQTEESLKSATQFVGKVVEIIQKQGYQKILFKDNN
jgi:uncharacterized protein (UPF0332 family)